jgi:Undecaprenyl-phosphate galactose phosphotransferase WbaP
MTTTSFQSELAGSEVDLDELDGTFEARVAADPGARVAAFVRSTAVVAVARGSRTELIPLDGEPYSATDASALVKILRRAVRTTAPFILSDLVALALAGLFALGVVRLFFPAESDAIGWVAPLALFPLIAIFFLSGLYSEIWLHPVIELRQTTHQLTIALGGASAAGMLMWPLPVWCVAAWVASIALVPMLRTIARHCCLNSDWWGYPALIIGTGDGAIQLARMIMDVPRSGLRPALLTDPHGKCRTCEVPVMNDPATLESLVRAQGIQHAVVSLPEFSTARLTEICNRYSGLVPHLLVLSDTSTLPTLWGASRNCGRLSGIEVRNGLLLATLQTGKRALDIVIAAAALLFGLPLIAVIAAVVKCNSPGPAFFGHTRIGRAGRPFKAWKFRSMYSNSKQLLDDYLAKNPSAREEWERSQKLRDDPRVTRVGRFLRKTSLDELPQMWNVLRGTMSLVGPRPIIESEIYRYGDIFPLYASVKPGVSGLWQVSGRTDLDYHDRVCLDQFYIRHWSPWLDIYILAKTFVALVHRGGAY